MLVATDYRGIRLVKCSDCGEIYSEDTHGCPNCGSNIVDFIWSDEDNEKSQPH